jgi:large subunit ribosomal protein L24
MANKFKIRKGDNVIVTAGKDSGKTGEVLLVYTNTSRVLVRGVNMKTTH